MHKKLGGHIWMKSGQFVWTERMFGGLVGELCVKIDKIIPKMATSHHFAMGVTLELTVVLKH